MFPDMRQRPVVWACLQPALPWRGHLPSLLSALQGRLQSWQMQEGLHRPLPAMCRDVCVALSTPGMSAEALCGQVPRRGPQQEPVLLVGVTAHREYVQCGLLCMVDLGAAIQLLVCMEHTV